MAAYPTSYLALVTRTQLARMLTETYARLRNIDPDESYARLEDALRDLTLIGGLQDAIWVAMCEERPETEPLKLIERAHKKLPQRKVFKAIPVRRKDEGAWTALSVLIDMNAGVATGEAVGLLDSPGGQDLLQVGFDLAGAHIAAEILK